MNREIANLFKIRTILSLFLKNLPYFMNSSIFKNRFVILYCFDFVSANPFSGVSLNDLLLPTTPIPQPIQMEASVSSSSRTFLPPEQSQNPSLKQSSNHNPNNSSFHFSQSNTPSISFRPLSSTSSQPQTLSRSPSFFGYNPSSFSPVNSTSTQIHRRSCSGSALFSSNFSTSSPSLSSGSFPFRESRPIPFKRSASQSGEQSIQFGGVLLPSSVISSHFQTHSNSNSLDSTLPSITRKWRSFDSDHQKWPDDFFDQIPEHEHRVRMEWTEAEDRQFLKGLKKYGVRFDLIAQELPRRTKDQV